MFESIMITRRKDLVGVPILPGRAYYCVDTAGVYVDVDDERVLVSCDLSSEPALYKSNSNCPNCGAPYDLHDIRCQYCGTIRK